MSPNEIKQLRLKDGDVLLITAPEGSSPDTVRDLVCDMEKALEGIPIPDIRIVGVAPGIRVEIEPAE